MEHRVRFSRPLRNAAVGDPEAAIQRPATPPTAEERALAEQQLRDTLASIEEEVRQLEARRSASLGELQHAAVELAVTVAARIVHEAIDAGQYAVEEKVAELIARMSPDEPLVVRLHPDDLELLNQRVRQLSVTWPEGREMRLEADAGIGRGSCRVDGRAYCLASHMETQLVELRQSLMEIAQDAQIERRSNAAGRAGIRRYPERRQTA